MVRLSTGHSGDLEVGTKGRDFVQKIASASRRVSDSDKRALALLPTAGRQHK